MTGDVDPITRRGLLRGAAGLGVLAGAGLLDAVPSVAAKGSRAPRPIPGGFDANFKPVPRHPVVHVLAPGIGSEMATITDFHGYVGASEIRGTAHGSDGSAFDFDTDMRFMRGDYVGLDRKVHHGTFGFI
jgi:hypothetical protein